MDPQHRGEQRLNSENLIVAAHELCAGYRGPVVGPLSFSLAQGEVVGLAGGNGAGKSTLLRAITGEARVFGGSCRIQPGVRIASLPQHLPELEELPLRARELLALYQDPAAPTGALPASLDGQLRRRVDRLSGGQRQILFVCAVLRQDADLVLLDEPTNNLDPETETWLTTALRARGQRRGMLIISHETQFLEDVCDRIVTVGP